MNKSRLFLLVKVQLMGYFGINKAMHSGNSERKRKFALQSVLGVIVFGYLAWMSYVYSNSFGQALLLLGGDLSILLLMMFFVASVLTLIMGVYQGGKTLFSYKDYDQVMSLPASPATVAASRLIVLYVYELLFTVILMAPAGVVYAKFVSPSAIFYPIYLLLMLTTPFIPLVLSALIGTVTVAFSSRAKRLGTLINVVLSLAVVIGVMAATMTMNGDTASMVNGIESISQSITSIYPLALMFSRAVSGPDILSAVFFIAVSVLILAAYSIIVATRYRAICSRVAASGQAKSSRANKDDLRGSSVSASLYKREAARYFSSSVYVVNTIFGLVMAVGGCALLWYFGGVDAILGLLQLPPGYDAVAGALVPMALSAMMCMSCTTGSSISIEGKQLWVLKSLPIDALQVFSAKIKLNLSLTFTAIAICAILLVLGGGLQIPVLLAAIVMPVILAVFCAVFGIFINLKMPKLDWTNEAAVVKQSAASMISMLVPAFILVGIIAIVFMRPQHAMLIMILSCAVPLILTFALLIYLKKRGNQIFSAL